MRWGTLCIWAGGGWCSQLGARGCGLCCAMGLVDVRSLVIWILSSFSMFMIFRSAVSSLALRRRDANMTSFFVRLFVPGVTYRSAVSRAMCKKEIISRVQSNRHGLEFGEP